MTLDAQIHQLLARMSVLSEVPAARTGDIVHGGEQSNAPKGPRRSMYDEFRVRYQGARSDRARELVIEEAKQAVRRHQLSQRGMVKGTQEWAIAIGLDPRPVEDVMHIYGCTERHVYRCRAEFKKSRNGSVAA